MSDLIQQHLTVLGHEVKDRVTGFTGVATSVCFDLYGCIQVIINPGVQTDGKLGESSWFDIRRVVIVNKTPIMDQPDFSQGPVAEGKKGPEAKPRITQS